MLLQHLQHGVAVTIEAINLECVVQQVASNFRRVGQKGGNLCIGQFLSGINSCVFGKASMSVVTSKPKTEWLILGSCVEKLLEACNVSAATSVRPASRVLRPSVLLEVAGAPRFAR